MSTGKPRTADGGRHQQWWLSNQGKPDGPHGEAYILAGLKTGAISPETYACRPGDKEWKRLCDWPMFAAACPATLPPPESASAATVGRAAWNPHTIGWLGLMFSPVWAGIMAAINGRRLHLNQPWWRPVAIGVGATVVDLLLSLAGVDSYILDLVLYLGAIGLIWVIDLGAQSPAFAERARRGQRAGWLVPSLLGSPLALIVFLGFVVGPLLPLEPREVCNRFARASSESEMKKYTTANLWPAIVALSKTPDNGPQPEFELTDEADAPANVGGYLVGYRLVMSDGREPTLLEGVFHLVQYDGPWKIEEMYFTSFNGENADPWVPLSKNYQQILAPSEDAGRPGAIAGESPPFRSSATSSSSSQATEAKGVDPWAVKLFPGPLRGPARFMYSHFGNAGIVLLAIFVAICAAGLIADHNKSKNEKR